MENFVITIARNYGSDGCAIAERLAGQLKIRLLDKELLSLVSQETGISEALLEQADEKVKVSLWDAGRERRFDPEYDRVDPNNPLSERNLFRYQAAVLRRLAERESLVVVGRAADYVLQRHMRLFAVNIQAPFDDCVAGIMKRKFVDAKTAVKDVRTINREREAFYKAYTGRDWNDPLNYDLCINSAKFSQEDCVALIRKGAGLKFKCEL